MQHLQCLSSGVTLHAGEYAGDVGDAGQPAAGPDRAQVSKPAERIREFRKATTDLDETIKDETNKSEPKKAGTEIKS